MKFTCSVIVEQPLKVVADLFAKPEYLKEYQEGFVRKEHVKGRPGRHGAVSKMYYENKGKTMLLTETIVQNKLPHSFKASYHHEHMDNTMHCTFKALDKSRTEYVSHIEYTEFRGFTVKTMAKLFPGQFKKQVQKWLDNFKEFAEKQ